MYIAIDLMTDAVAILHSGNLFQIQTSFEIINKNPKYSKPGKFLVELIKFLIKMNAPNFAVLYIRCVDETQKPNKETI